MAFSKYRIRKAGLDALYFGGASKLLRSAAAGVGAILMLHRVRPARAEEFQPNKYLEITPDFLERAIGWLKRSSYEFVSIDEAQSRLVNRRFDRRFVAITLDDGYRDVKEWAQPVLRKFGVPYAVYIAAEFAEGAGHLWWHHLESIVAQNDRMDVDGCRIDCGSVPEKQSAYARLEEMVVSQADHSAERAFIHRLAARHDYDPTASARSLCMDWDEIREISADPLATIGAHTISHPMLAKIPETQVRTELAQSRRILEEKLQRNVAHLAYPYGTTDAVGPREFKIASEAGYQTAITTYPEVLGAADGSRLLQLPRLNVDGNYQRERYLDVLLSGVASAVWNKMRGLRELYAGAKATALGGRAA